MKFAEKGCPEPKVTDSAERINWQSGREAVVQCVGDFLLSKVREKLSVVQASFFPATLFDHLSPDPATLFHGSIQATVGKTRNRL